MKFWDKLFAWRKAVERKDPAVEAPAPPPEPAAKPAAPPVAPRPWWKRWWNRIG